MSLSNLIFQMGLETEGGAWQTIFLKKKMYLSEIISVILCCCSVRAAVNKMQKKLLQTTY